VRLIEVEKCIFVFPALAISDNDLLNRESKRDPARLDCRVSPMGTRAGESSNNPHISVIRRLIRTVLVVASLFARNLRTMW